MNNLFDITTLKSDQGEIFEPILSKGKLRIERIVTLTPYAQPGEWYDQELDEWVVLLQGSAVLEYKSGETVKMRSGDHLFIPAHKVHRVKQSSAIGACIWLALHGNLK